MMTDKTEPKTMSVQGVDVSQLQPILQAEGEILKEQAKSWALLLQVQFLLWVRNRSQVWLDKIKAKIGDQYDSQG